MEVAAGLASQTESEVTSMGSTGSGRLSDYSNSGSSKPSGGAGSSGAGGSGTGGSSGVDQCKQAFSCVLEEVAQCEYYEKNKSLPAEGTELIILVDKRVVAADREGVVVGALPTSKNYIAGCINDGYEYIGIVKSSTRTPIPSISADFISQTD